MTRQTLIYFLNKSGLSGHQWDGVNSDYINIHCPFAPFTHDKKKDRHPSLMVKIPDSGPVQTYCFTCGVRLDLWLLMKKVAGLHSVAKMREVADELYEYEQKEQKSVGDSVADQLNQWQEVKQVHLPNLQKYFEEMENNFPFYAKDYLTKRGLRDNIINDFDLRYDKNEARVVLPVRGDRNFLGMVGRAIDDSTEPRLRNYGGSRLSLGLGRRKDFEPRGTIFIVEGPFDLMKTHQNLTDLGVCGEVVCTFKARASSEQVDQLLAMNGQKICLYDNGRAGKEGGEHLQRNVSCLRAFPPEGKDPGTMTPQDLQEIIENTNTLRRRLSNVVVETRWI